MKFTPHRYQQDAIKFLMSRQQACLMLDMGLGKTVITLSALAMWHAMGQTQKILIIAPKRVALHTWPTEIKKWGHTQHLEFQTIHGTSIQREKQLDSPAPIHIINRENLPWLTKTLTAWPYDTVIIDELSSFKNPAAQRTRALLKNRKHIQRIIGLTGTPAPNGLLDLFAQYLIFDGGKRLGRRLTTYRNTYFHPTSYVYGRPVNWQLNQGAEQAIYSHISDITLSMQATDHLTMPPLTTTTAVAHMSPQARSRYEELKKDLITTIQGETIVANNAATLSNKLIQLASGAVYNENGDTVRVHNAKLDTLEDLIEASNGKPLLVAYWFKSDLVRIQQRFPHARTLSGPQDFDDWNNGLIPLALIHPASAGHGLNLQQGGSHLVWFTTPWSLELYQQANARLYRQGQTEPVVITHIATAGTIDTRVIRALETKRTTQDDLFSAVKAELYPERKN